MKALKRTVLVHFRRWIRRCGDGCSSGGSGAHCPEVEISMENMRSNLMVTPGNRDSLQGSATIATARGASLQQHGGSYSGRDGCSLATSTRLGSYSALGAVGLNTGGIPSFVSNTGRGSSPRTSMGPRGSVVSTLSGTARKPSGSTLISLASMLADRDLNAANGTNIIAAMSASTPITASGMQNSCVNIRERRSSRGFDSQQDRELDHPSRNEVESSHLGITSLPSKSIRQRSLSSIINDGERRGPSDNGRRWERDRRDRENEPHFYEIEPFVESRICLDERVKVSWGFFFLVLLL